MDLSQITDSDIGRQVRIDLSLRKHLGSVEHRLVEQWQATAYFTADAQDLDDDADDNVIGYAHIVKCRLRENQVPDLLDFIEADLHTVSSAVLDPESGYPTEEVAAETEGFGSDFLILNRVEIAKSWRGRGLGRWFAAEALDTLSHGADFAATYPAPIDESRGEARKAAENKLRDVWGDIGFQPLSGDVMILDLNLVTLDSTLQSMRKKFGAL